MHTNEFPQRSFVRYGTSLLLLQFAGDLRRYVLFWGGSVGTIQILRFNFLLIISLLLASGCAHKPIAFYDNDVFLGAFLNGENKKPGCYYSYIQGSGIKLGLLNFGMGYFSKKKLEVDKNVAEYCKSDIAEVFVTGDELTKENIIFK